jgi:hypothetical protein
MRRQKKVSTHLENTLRPEIAVCSDGSMQMKAMHLSTRCVLVIGGLLCSLLLAACGGGGGGGAGAGGGSGGGTVLTGDYFPLPPKAVWVNTVDNSPEITRVGSQVQVAGQNTTEVFTTDANGTAIYGYYYRVASDGIWSVVPDSADAMTKKRFNYQVLKFPLTVGQTWSQVDTTSGDSGIDIDGDGRTDMVTFNEVATVTGVESVVTPAGSFENCAHVQQTINERYTLSSNGTQSTYQFVEDTWYAPGIGQVQYKVQGTYNNQTSSLVNSTLSSYRVGALHTQATPTITSTSPSTGSFSAAPTIGATFAQLLDPVSLAAGWHLTGPDGKDIAGTVTVNASGLSATWTPSAHLADGQYSASIDTSVTDLVGNPVAPQGWTFAVDSTAPQLVSVVPASGATRVALNAPVTITFSEVPKASTVNTNTVWLTVTTNGYATVPASVSLVGSVATLTPDAPLTAGATYQLNIVGVTDAAGNQLVAPQSSLFKSVEAFNAQPLPDVLAGQVTPLDGPLAAGDVDGDGRTDLVLASRYNNNPNSGKLLLYRQLADGTLALPVVLSDNDYSQATRVTLVDLNGDGRLDLVVTAGQTDVYLQGPTGTFSLTAQLWHAKGAVVVDLDGDGRLDIVGVDGNPNAVYLYRQLADGSFSSPVQLASFQGIAGLAVGDLNGDGRPDIAVINSWGGYTVNVLLQQADGSFSAPSTLALNEWITFLGDLVIADVNGDGRADLLLSHDNKVSVFAQQTDGSLVLQQSLVDSYTSGQILLADVDGNGRLDVAVFHAGQEKFGVFMQRADGTFASEKLFSAPYGSGYYQSTAGDFNGDGNVDFVTGGSVLLREPSMALSATATTAGQAKVVSALRAPGNTSVADLQRRLTLSWKKSHRPLQR